MRERHETINGPYRRGRRWRVVETSATGAHATCSFASEADAIEYIASFTDASQGRTVSAVLDVYLAHRKTDLGPRSLVTLGHRLKAILQVVARDRLLSQFTPAVAAELYRSRSATVKPDTHRGELAAASAMLEWCRTQGWLAVNPFANVHPTGRKAVRSEHLRIAEARRFLTAALEDGTNAGLAAAIALLLGLRASEVTDRCVRDVDDGARVLWIDHAKSKAGNRHVIVPAILRARLVQLTASRAGGERVFPGLDRHGLLRHVRRLCKALKVAGMSTHALRRTWSAISAETMPMDHVSKALGHASTSITRRHYQPGNAEERRSNAVALSAIAGGKR